MYVSWCKYLKHYDWLHLHRTESDFGRIGIAVKKYWSQKNDKNLNSTELHAVAVWQEERRKDWAVNLPCVFFPPISFCVAGGERRDLNSFMVIFGGCQLSVLLKVVLKLRLERVILSAETLWPQWPCRCLMLTKLCYKEYLWLFKCAANGTILLFLLHVCSLTRMLDCCQLCYYRY